ncbi:cobalamin-binding protein [Mycolicibacterium duvalii]|uniref:Cobalamin-binding protein n=1 Tax=Mycolicibacterium duvalii TaxID=39688 RepID=A0A7I7K843_9MYCO|nr:cobalamin-dependent protein [Mycolicibacterium duvalii]MCV7366143.1 cobalamin B12-binding domain-containing protein [Mycolicibacterium duvalii]PEG38801.1 cobalamin-binding protein [Mycolicibacterium duvalii]BBX19592.1 cobalamin-binding protein [Mycolicibacterium duvalii]
MTVVGDSPDPHEDLREALWAAAVDGDEYTAVGLVYTALDNGTPAEEVLLEVLARVQRRVGMEWAANRITVAQEHAATAINDRVIAALAHHPSVRRPASAGRVTVACVDGEWHAMPARLLAEVLRLHGWQVDFLGAQVPTPHLISHINQHGPDVVALSCSIATRLPTAHAAITACHVAGAPVLVGGAAFGADGRLAERLGADAWAPDARSAVARLAQGFGPVRVAPTHQAVDDLPHLADQEYTMVRTSAGRLVQTTVSDLEQSIPAMRDYTAQQRQHTTEDVAHIVDFLATALYTDDDELFTQFIGWTADILDARGVPAASLLPSLDSLATQLAEFPRAQRLLGHARASLPVPLSADPKLPA